MNKLSTNLMIILLISSLSPYIIYELTPNDTIEFSNELIIGTYNLHYGITGDGVYSLTGLKGVLKEVKPDLIGFQEVTFSSPYNGFVNFHQNLVDMMTKLGYEDHYISEGYGFNLANAFASHYSIISTGTYIYRHQNLYMRHFLDVRVKIGNSILQFITTHLTHIPNSGESGEVRIQQINELINYATETSTEVDYQVIVGDFNVRMIYEDILTEEYLLMNSTFKDAWPVSGSLGTGFTSTAKDPSKTIDFIWVSQNINVLECEVVNTLQSDHLPLFCSIELS